MPECGPRRLLVFRLTASLITMCLISMSGSRPKSAHASSDEYFLARQRGPTSRVRSVSVDRRGVVWTAGTGGVCNFDGLATRCLNYGAAEFVAASSTNDDVWAVFSDGTLRRLHPAPWPDSQTRVAGLATALLVTQDQVWISSNSGLFVVRAGQPLHRVLHEPVQTLVSLGAGEVLTLSSGRVTRYDSRLHHTMVVSEKITSPVIGLFAAADRGWFTATERELFHTDNRGHTVVRADFFSRLKTPSPSAAMQTEDGAIWMGSPQGLLHLRAGATNPNQVRSLPSWSPNFAITALASSSVTRMWLATSMGTFEVQSQFPSHTLSDASGDEIPIAFAVAAAPQNALWLTTGNSVRMVADGQRRNYGRAEGLKIPDLRGIAVDTDGEVWTGGLGSGLFKLDQKNHRWVSQAAIWSTGVRAIVPSREGGLWLGLEESGLVRIKGGRAQVIIPPAEGGANRVRDILEGEDGRVWVAFASGKLSVVRQGTVDDVPIPAAAGDVGLMCLLADGQGGVLVGSNGRGLFRVNAGTFERVTEHQGLADDHIHGLTTDRQGRLWMSTRHGISYSLLTDVLETLNGERRSFHSVDWAREEGITGEPVRGFAKSAVTLSDGTLAFPALNGLIRVDPSLLRSPPPPEVILNEVDFGTGTAYQALPSDVLRFRSGNAQLHFTFSAPKHPRPHRLKFRFRLLGLETAWRLEARLGEARYAGVAPGTYHFEVQAVAEKEEGGSGAVISATVRIEPPWYSTWQLRALALAMLIAGILGKQRYRAAKIMRVIDAKAAERSRIAADIHDGLSQDLAGLGLQIEAAQASLHKDPISTQKFLHRAALLLQDSLKDLRDSVWGLNHDEVDTDALVSGLRERLIRSTQDTPVSIRIESAGPRCAVTSTVAWQITQIAREAVANAIKHAAAKQIVVSLCATVDLITLAVKDDGRGITTTMANPGVGRGFGLAGMQARAQAIGAAFRLTNNQSGGTRIELVVPRVNAAGSKKSTS
jgi:signal transduction histidine kinase/ligand-binding sensor domain-containing protein